MLFPITGPLRKKVSKPPGKVKNQSPLPAPAEEVFSLAAKGRERRPPDKKSRCDSQRESPVQPWLNDEGSLAPPSRGNHIRALTTIAADDDERGLARIRNAMKAPSAISGKDILQNAARAARRDPVEFSSDPGPVALLHEEARERGSIGLAQPPGAQVGGPPGIAQGIAGNTKTANLGAADLRTRSIDTAEAEIQATERNGVGSGRRGRLTGLPVISAGIIAGFARDLGKQ